MDLTSVIVALITGVCSLVAIILQKGDKKINNHLAEQNQFMKKSIELNDNISRKEQDILRIVRKIDVYNLKTNVYILQIISKSDEYDSIIKEIDETIDKFEALQLDIIDLKDEREKIDGINKVICEELKNAKSNK